MRCKNCGKEVDDSHNYCVKCGEKLNDYDKLINSELLDNERIEVNNEEKKLSIKDTIKNNKKILAVIGGVVVGLIIVKIIVNMLSGQPLDKGEIRDTLIGNRIYVGQSLIMLSDENIADIEILDRETVNKDRDNVNLKINLTLEMVDIDLEYNVQYYYDKGWIYLNGDVGEVLEVNPDKGVEEALREEIKNVNIQSSYGGMIKGDYVKEISNIMVKKDGKEDSFTANAVLTNGIVSQKGNISGKMKFSLDDLRWVIFSTNFEKTEEEVFEEKIDEGILKNLLMDMIGGDEGRDYKYENESGNTIRFNIVKEMISEINLKDIDISEDEKYILIQVQGKIRNNIIKDMAFNGEIKLNRNISENSMEHVDINIDSVELVYPTVEEIKELMTYNSLDEKIINKKVADTFVEESRDISERDTIYINGKINIDREVKNVQLRVVLFSNKGEYFWTILDVYTKDSYLYKEF